MRIGVLAIQGSFSLHICALKQIGVESVEIRRPEQLEGLDGLIMPGGESTTFSILFDQYGFAEILRKKILGGMPVWGTCAGAILLGYGVEKPLPRLNLIDIDIFRNAYGRQVDSFIAPLKIKGIEGEEFQGVFIRAPRIARIGPDVEILSILNEDPVMVQQHNILISSFHPELTSDFRVHRFFIEKVCLKEANQKETASKIYAKELNSLANT